jgi:hypothetical protein
MVTTTHDRREKIMNDKLLRLALRVDAAACAGMGLVLAAGAAALDDALGIPAGWLVGLGAVLIVFGAGLGWLSATAAISPALGWGVVAGNLGWVLASVAAIVAGWWPLTAAGVAIVIVQAAIVVALAELEWMGLRRLAAT